MMSPLLWIPVARQRECAPRSQSHAQNLSSNPHPSKGAFVVAPQKWWYAHLSSFPFVPAGDLADSGAVVFSQQSALKPLDKNTVLISHSLVRRLLNGGRFFPGSSGKFLRRRICPLTKTALFVRCFCVCFVWRVGEREGGRRGKEERREKEG